MSDKAEKTPNNRVTDWPILRYLAKISPSHYAALIEDRNTAALLALDLAWRYVREGRPISLRDRNSVHPDSRLTCMQSVSGGWYVEWLIPLGCPHCVDDCITCLWTTAILDTGSQISGYRAPCCSIRFGGVTSAGCPCVAYMPDGVEIHMDSETTFRQYTGARRFLREHIKWGRREYWAARLNKGRR